MGPNDCVNSAANLPPRYRTPAQNHVGTGTAGRNGSHSRLQNSVTVDPERAFGQLIFERTLFGWKVVWVHFEAGFCWGRRVGLRCSR
jgi:hypothetical protein